MSGVEYTKKGCWIRPSDRLHAVMSKRFSRVEAHSKILGWQKQGFQKTGFPVPDSSVYGEAVPAVQILLWVLEEFQFAVPVSFLGRAGICPTKMRIAQFSVDILGNPECPNAYILGLLWESYAQPLLYSSKTRERIAYARIFFQRRKKRQKRLKLAFQRFESPA